MFVTGESSFLWGQWNISYVHVPAHVLSMHMWVFSCDSVECITNTLYSVPWIHFSESTEVAVTLFDGIWCSLYPKTIKCWNRTQVSTLEYIYINCILSKCMTAVLKWPRFSLKTRGITGHKTHGPFKLTVHLKVCYFGLCLFTTINVLWIFNLFIIYLFY